MSGEFADLMLGYYGQAPGERDPEVVALAEQQARSRRSRRPADLLKPEWHCAARGAMALPGCNGSDEDVLTYAMFPQVAPKFFATPRRRAEEPGQGSGRRRPGHGQDRCSACRRRQRLRPRAHADQLRRDGQRPLASRLRHTCPLKRRQSPTASAAGPCPAPDATHPRHGRAHQILENSA
jgi:hypothetical protein